MAPSKGRGRGRGRGRGKIGETGPSYPSRLLKEIGLPLDLNDRKRRHSRKSGKPADHQPEDVYEYQEGVPQEESGKNRRFDAVDKLEYELPSDFEDEEIDEGAASGEENAGKPKKDDEGGEESEEEIDDEEEDDEDEEEAEERHEKMLMEVTARSNKQAKKVKEDSGSMYDEEAPITVEDLLAPLEKKPGFNALKKRIRSLQTATPVSIPLPKNIQEKIDRKAGYEKTVEDITKWQPIVKKNREAPSLDFRSKANATLSTTTAMAADFEPSTAFEKEMAALLKEHGVADPSEIEAKENLELNKLSVEEVRDRQQRLARMRSLLFRHEERAKRIKKIKSKTYRRLARKSQNPKEQLLTDDPDLLLEETMKQEFNRARERMTLKHKNTSRWAKRIIKRGLQQHNEGTREAITEQLREHALLTRKINSTKSDGSGSSDDDDDDEDQDDDHSDNDDEPGLVLDKPRSKDLAKAKVATLKALEEGNDDLPKTGIFALPFMVRAIEKKKREAEDEARAVLEELESGGPGAESSNPAPLTGKLAFGALANKSAIRAADEDDDLVERGTDSEGSEDEGLRVERKLQQFAPKQKPDAVRKRIDPVSGSSIGSEGVDLDDKVGSAVEHTTKVDAPITIAGDGSASKREKQKKKKKKEKKTKNKNKNTEQNLDEVAIGSTQHSVISANPTLFGIETTPRTQLNDTNIVDTANIKVAIAGRPRQAPEEQIETELEDSKDSDEDSDEEADDPVGGGGGGDGVIVPRTQEELIREAFAGDDVEAEFQAAKDAVIDEECPQPELDQTELPGWGQWTSVQKKRGPPKWMVKQQEEAERKKKDAEKRRMDAKLKHVIISQKGDKKASKLLVSTLPFPYTSKEVFEKAMRMPLGRDYNPMRAFQDLTRPSVIKRAGVIINPIEYEDVEDDAQKKRKAGNDINLLEPRRSKKDRKTTLQKV